MWQVPLGIATAQLWIPGGHSGGGSGCVSI